MVFALFLIAALAECIAGESYRAEGHLDVYPWLGVAFFVAALALAGVPPSSGFIGKFGLIRSLLEAGGTLRVAVAVSALVAGFCLLYAGMQIWRGFFWGASDAVHRVHLPRGATSVTGVAVVLVLALAVFGGPIFGAAERVAGQLDGNRDYLEAVLPAEQVRGE